MSKGPEIKRDITVEVVSRAAGEGDVEYLLGALVEPGLEVRIATVEGLGLVGGKKAESALLSIARDRGGENPKVRIAALRSLGLIHDSDGYASILEGFVKSDNRRVVSAARKMLSKADPVGYPARLVRQGCLDHSAIGVYKRSAERGAVPLLRDFLYERMRKGDLASTGYWGKVYGAVKALGSIGGEQAAGTLEMLEEWLSSERDSTTGFSLKEKRLAKITEVTGSATQGPKRDNRGAK